MWIPFDYYNEGASKREGKSFGTEPEAMQSILEANTRVWLVLHQSDVDPNRQSTRWFDEQAELLNTIDFYNLHIRLYVLNH